MMYLTKMSFYKLVSIKFLTVTGSLLLLMIFSLQTVRAQESSDVFPAPDSYKTEGIPAIKKSEVDHLFYDPSTIRSNLIWDTDVKNRRLLVTDETNNVYLLNTPLLQPVKLIEKIIPNSVKVNPNGKNFAYTSDHEDEDNYQLYLYDFNEKTSKKPVNLIGKDESIESIVWSKNGDSLFFMRVDYDAKISKLCRFDFTSEKCFPAELKGGWTVIQTTGDKVILKHFKSSSNQLLYVYDYRLNKLIPVDEKGNSRKSFLVGDRVFWTSEGNEYCKSDPCILSMNLKNNKIIQMELPKDFGAMKHLSRNCSNSNPSKP